MMSDYLDRLKPKTLAILKRMNAECPIPVTRLKRKQEEAISKASDSDEVNVLPCGYGKTVIAQVGVRCFVHDFCSVAFCYLLSYILMFILFTSVFCFL